MKREGEGTAGGGALPWCGGCEAWDIETWGGGACPA